MRKIVLFWVDSWAERGFLDSVPSAANVKTRCFDIQC